MWFFGFECMPVFPGSGAFANRCCYGHAPCSVNVHSTDGRSITNRRPKHLRFAGTVLREECMHVLKSSYTSLIRIPDFLLTKFCFGRQELLSDLVFSIAVGTPITNCQDGANSDITDTIGGSETIGETWSADASIGLNFGPLKIQAGGNWSHSNSITYDQKIGITVHPGYKVCYLFFR